MKKKYHDYFIFTIGFALIAFTLINQNLTHNTILKTSYLWFTKVFPSLFPLILINQLLIGYHLPAYIFQLFKTRGLKLYVIILSMLSGTPNNAVIIKELYQTKMINLNQANHLLIYTFYLNPLFLKTMLTLSLNSNTVLRIMIVFYTSNLILSFWFKLPSNPIKPDFNTPPPSFNKMIIKTMKVLLVVLGTMIFYLLLATLGNHLFKLNKINTFFSTGILEISNGLNTLTLLTLNSKLKALLALMIISFGGLAIHSQIKSILATTPINYHYFLYGRLLTMIITPIGLSLSYLIF